MAPTRYRPTTFTVPRLVLLALFLAMPSLHAAGLEDEVRDTVLNARIEAHWSDDGTGFWYRRQSAPGHHQFIRVDATTARRAPAFDHQRMAQALAAALHRPVEAEALPITDLLFPDGRSVILAVDGRWWETPLDTIALVTSPRAPHPVWESAIRPTRHTGDETFLHLTNRSAAPVELRWIGFDGHQKTYATIAAGASHRQQTHIGHVWMVARSDGTSLGVVEAGGGNATLEVDGTPPAPPAPAPDPNRSSDGHWQAVIRKHDLWLEARPSGEAVRLTGDGSTEDHYELPVHWSPDGTHLVVWRNHHGDHRTITLVESSPADQLQPKTRTIPYAKPGDRVDEKRPCLFRIADRQQIPIANELFANPWSCGDLAWRPDGTAFTFLFNQRGHQVLRVVAVDLHGTARALIDEHAATFIDYSGKLHFQPLAARNEIIWMSERDGWNHLWRHDAGTGQVKNQITRGAWAVRAVERIDEQAGLIWFTAHGIVPGEDPYHLHHARVALDGSGLTVLTQGDGTHEVAWSPERRWFIDTWSRVDAPPQHVLRDGSTGRLVLELERADISALRATGWQMPERFTAKGRDGTTDIYGVLWRPRGFDPARHYPVVESIYAGPHGAFVPKAFKAFFRQQAIAEAGFVVAQIDGMGTNYRSKAFHDVCWKNLADAGFPDRIRWWKAAAATRPWLDLGRVGIYGGSAGGQNALGALLWHPEFYQVAVADCGCHDNRMDKIWWNEQWMGWPIGPHYAEQSNVTQAHRLQGKLMLIVGEVDENVDPSSTFQVAHALEKAGKDFELVIIQGQGHGAAETPFGSRKRLDFLTRNLGVHPQQAEGLAR